MVQCVKSIAVKHACISQEGSASGSYDVAHMQHKLRLLPRVFLKHLSLIASASNVALVQCVRNVASMHTCATRPVHRNHMTLPASKTSCKLLSFIELEQLALMLGAGNVTLVQEVRRNCRQACMHACMCHQYRSADISASTSHNVASRATQAAHAFAHFVEAAGTDGLCGQHYFGARGEERCRQACIHLPARATHLICMTLLANNTTSDCFVTFLKSKWC